MGYTEACFQDSDETLCRTAFGDQVDFDTLLREGYARLDLPEAPFAQGNFPTASGRCEFDSPALARITGDGLPAYLPNYESTGTGSPYPLAMISPPARNFLNSTFVNVQSLRDIETEPVLEMHPADAAARDLADGQTVRIYNDRGEYHCRLRLNGRAREGVVNGMGIWWRKLGLRGTNVNELTSQRITDLGNGPVFYDCLVEVAAA